MINSHLLSPLIMLSNKSGVLIDPDDEKPDSDDDSREETRSL